MNHYFSEKQKVKSDRKIIKYEIENKKFEFYNPGYLYIKTRTEKQIIPLVSKKDTKEVREYFLNKLNIDIGDKINYFM